MPADLPFHLGRGDTGPVQQSPVTCGSAALTVARMLVNPEFARWIVSGIDPSGGPPDSRPERDRFAEHERAVMNRTNGFRAAGGQWNIPWPHALGTPPWGAKTELEYGADKSTQPRRNLEALKQFITPLDVAMFDRPHVLHDVVQNPEARSDRIRAINRPISVQNLLVDLGVGH